MITDEYRDLHPTLPKCPPELYSSAVAEYCDVYCADNEWVTTNYIWEAAGFIELDEARKLYADDVVGLTGEAVPLFEDWLGENEYVQWADHPTRVSLIADVARATSVMYDRMRSAVRSLELEEEQLMTLESYR